MKDDERFAKEPLELYVLIVNSEALTVTICAVQLPEPSTIDATTAGWEANATDSVTVYTPVEARLNVHPSPTMMVLEVAPFKVPLYKARPVELLT